MRHLDHTSLHKERRHENGAYPDAAEDVNDELAQITGESIVFSLYFLLLEEQRSHLAQ